jgi:tetratricopeptide (TPR) repeat protein
LLLANRYQLEETLGQGGAGVVHRAFDTQLQRPVAIKSLDTSRGGPDQGVERLRREAALLSRLNHSNIVGLYDIGEEAGQPYLVLEYIAGCTLRALLEAQPEPFPIDMARHIMRGVLAALSAAHQAGVIHRDLKPENIMLVGVEPESALDPGELRPEVKVMDFGLAYLSGDVRITTENLVAGTALYLAPEVALGQPFGGQADLYAAGVILYELIAGRPPFRGDDALVVISQHLHATPISPRWHNADIPSTLAAMTLKLLAKNPADRYQTAGAVLADLAAIDTERAEDRALTEATFLQAIARGRMVGREQEVAHLRQAIDGMLNYHGQVVFIEGEPGIGKSRLVQEVGVYARLKGAQVFTGHCYDADLTLPYQPFIEIVRTYVQTRLEPDTSGRLPAGLAAELVKLAPGLEARLGVAPAPAESSPAEARLRLFEAVTTLLTAGPEPVVLILENLHWANPPDLALLHHLAQTGARHRRLLLIVTYRASSRRSGPVATITETMTQLNRAGLATQLSLAPLSPEQVTDLLETLLEGQVSPEFCQAIFDVTEGNPFFVEETLKALIAEAKIFRDPARGRWEVSSPADLEIPASLKDVIERRFETLSEAQRQVLHLAALLGRRFRLDALLASTEAGEALMLATLDKALEMQLIRRVRSSERDRTEQYEFEHALIRQALQDSLGPGQRSRLHRQIGYALEQLNQGQSPPPARPDELAYHFSLAGPDEKEKTISYSLIAVENALRVYASEMAIKHYQLILELLGNEGHIARRAWIMEQLGDIYLRRTRQIVDAVAAYEAAIQLWQMATEPDRSALIRLYRHMGEITRYWPGHVTRLDTYLAEALRLLDANPDQAESLERARVLTALAFNRHARPGPARADEEALELAQGAVELAARLEAADEESTALDAMQQIYRSQGDLPAAHEIDRRRLALIPRLTDPTEKVDVHLGASYMGWEMGDLAAAAKSCHEALAIAKRTDNIGGQWTALGRLVMLHLQWGKLAEAVNYAHQGVALGPRAGLLELGQSVEAMFRAHLAILNLLQGQAEAAARELAELEALYPVAEVPPYRSALGWLHYETQTWVEARPYLESEPAFPPPFLPRRFDLFFRVEVYGHQDDEAALNEIGPAAQAELQRREAPYLQVVYHRGYGAFYAAQEAWPEAEAAFKRALAATRGKTLWYQDARTWLDYGRMLARRNRPGDIDLAHDFLSEAQSMFTTFGAFALAEKAWIELTRLSQ